MNIKNIKGIVLLGLVASIGLSSCQVVNKYKSPEVDTTGLFRDETPTDTTTIANIPWREYFTDPILQGLIEEGLANNFDLQMSFARIKQAEASLSMARAAYFPSVALVGGVTQNRASSYDPLTKTPMEKNVLGYHSEQYSLGISATWEADIWGKLNRQSRASYADFLNSHAAKNLVQTSLISNIATSYYTLLTLDEQLRISLETVELLKETVTTMQALMDAGMLNAAAVEQSKSLLYNTQVSIPDLESNIRQMENSICVMLGRKPGPIFRGVIREQIVPQMFEHGIPAQMLAKRPDVQSAELSFRSAFELKNAAQASFYPSITLGTGSIIGYGSTTLSKFFQPENIFANIIGSISQPIFAKKQLIGQLKIRKAQEEEAFLGFQKAVLTASTEVSDVLFAYKSSISKNDTRTQQVESLGKAVHYTKELLKAGEANYTEVLTAEQNYLQAQLGQTSDKLEQLQASVNLYRALGGGIE
jgi:NodT family efflux transporter outer membrane factor (OMF) lipoprotein